jgi:hypothetical protein
MANSTLGTGEGLATMARWIECRMARARGKSMPWGAQWALMTYNYYC